MLVGCLATGTQTPTKAIIVTRMLKESVDEKNV